MLTENNIFKTKVVNLSDLQDFSYSIPTYQRPYVWGEEQLKKFLDDFYKTFTSTKEDYFIGTFLTEEDGFHAELIDGQQRFTTLWLISFVINTMEPTSKITNFLKKGDVLRLSFDIREEISDYFKFLLDREIIMNRKFDENSIKQYPYLTNIASGLTFIRSYLDQIPKEEIKDFGNYIFENIYLIKNTTPRKTDLNKLFSTINSAGVQLEQTDIIKANLLNLIDDKVTYGKIWETCENLNDFFERNVRASFPQSDFKSINLTRFIAFDSEVFKYENQEDNFHSEEGFSVDNVDLKTISDYSEPVNRYKDEQRDSEEVFCRSIINFGQLLLHTYRLHLKIEGLRDFEGTFHVNRLISIFKSLEERNNPEEIKKFFVLLWKVRFLFDKYIIKWISDVDNKTEVLELMNYNKNEKSYYSRAKYSKSSTLMLQSILYFTGDYLRQFWLTSYLGYLLDNHLDLEPVNETLLNKLEDIDNSFSLNNNLTDKDASLRLIDSAIDTSFSFENYLKENKGTQFKHYWFQKLDYILWKNWDEPKTSEFENFRVISRNSVEHIYPQHPDNPVKSPPLIDEHLHSFGNLVLLSVSQNSEYSDKSYDEKKGLFKNKNSNTYDTLKSYYIFMKNDNWGSDEIVKHRDLMIEKIQKHYQN